ncbi:MAG TPA: type II toxin-antitoxin system VapC family toxin [Mucilaginibacter sp.]|jgi:predicted nucleic acid-binding protein
MAERFLIDTSAVIKYLNGTLSANGLLFMDKAIANKRIISFISEIELQSWNPDNPDDLKIYQFFISNSTVIGIDNDIIQETIRIRKSVKLKLPDALIAATAIINNLTLIADNDKDFKKVSELNYANPNTVTI